MLRVYWDIYFPRDQVNKTKLDMKFSVIRMIAIVVLKFSRMNNNCAQDIVTSNSSASLRENQSRTYIIIRKKSSVIFRFHQVLPGFGHEKGDQNARTRVYEKKGIFDQSEFPYIRRY
jgi:hypothetical protein